MSQASTFTSREVWTVWHVCGHREEHTVEGTAMQQCRRVEWLQEQRCLRCEAIDGRKISQCMDLPPLALGSERQINWAESIRAAFWKESSTLRIEIERHARQVEMTPEQYADGMGRFDAIRWSVASTVDAKWWIGKRKEGALAILRQALAEGVPA